MDMLKIFEKAEFGEVKVMRDEVGDLLFVGKDIAKALGYPESSLTNIPVFSSLYRTNGRKPIPPLGGEQEMLVVSEAGLYFFLPVRANRKPYRSRNGWQEMLFLPSAGQAATVRRRRKTRSCLRPSPSPPGGSGCSARP